MAAVGVIDHKSNNEPDEETNPVDDGEACHQEDAGENRDDRRDDAAGRAERARAVRFAITKNQDARGDERESEESTNIRKIGKSADVEKARRNPYHEPRHPSCEIRRTVITMDAAEY